MATLSSPGSQIPRQGLHALRPLGLLTILAICGAIGAYWLLLVPAEKERMNLQTTYDTARQRQLELHRERTTQEDVRRLQQQLAAVWGTLPAQTDFASTAIEISELARSERVSVPGMSYRHTKAEGGLPAKAALTFTATGDYRHIYRFIHRLESREPYLVIEQLDAARTMGSRRKGSHAVKLSIRVVTFLKPPPALTEAS